MTEPTNHTVTVHIGFGNGVTAPVIYVRDLGGNRALVHLETNFSIDEHCDHLATYSTGGKKAEGKYKVTAKVYSAASETHIIMGIFTRDDATPISQQGHKRYAFLLRWGETGGYASYVDRCQEGGIRLINGKLLPRSECFVKDFNAQCLAHFR
jgi:hypothetical protein